METKKATIADLVQDDRNFNRHSEYGMGLLEKSVSKFGMGRSILLDRNNKIIAGNGITETAGQLGIEDVEIVETDGSKIVAVKRTDIDLDSPEGREMALADNATNAANLRWDKKMLDQVAAESDIDPKAWGIDFAQSRKLLQREREAAPDIQEWPITILQSQEEYDMFNEVRDSLGLGSRAETFRFILEDYYNKHLLK